MTTLARLTITMVIAILLTSCNFDINFGEGVRGNGEVVEDSREITEKFTMVSASEGIDVYVSQSDEFQINIEADENVMDLIGTEIKNGKLRIHAIKSIGRATKKVYVFLPEITSLSSSSGADLLAKTPIKSNKIKLNSSSGADMQVEVIATEVIADCSSGADIKLSGEANVLHADASSGSDIKARNFIAKICHADASSGADISVQVSESLTAEATSGADITYSGNATVTKNKSASGSVRKY